MTTKNRSITRNRVLSVKVARNDSNPRLNGPCLIRFSFPASPDCLPRAFWAICSHFCIKEHSAKWKISSLWSFRAQDGQDWTKIDWMVTLFLRRAASRRAALSLSLSRRRQANTSNSCQMVKNAPNLTFLVSKWKRMKQGIHQWKNQLNQTKSSDPKLNLKFRKKRALAPAQRAWIRP